MASLEMPQQAMLRELLRDIVVIDSDCSISGISSDSRQVNAGDAFIAVAGLTSHAIDFAADAIAAGAVAVLFDADDGYSQERVDWLRQQSSVQWIAVPALAANSGVIASRFYANPSHDLTLIGVTGTDGKTSVTHLLVQALQQTGKRAGSIGTLGYGVANRFETTMHTTPDAVSLQAMLSDLRGQSCDTVVMEVSSHALDQFRVSGCKFDIAVLTNLGSDHLDYHKTMENYAQAKSRLFQMDGLRGRVLNADDDLGATLLQRFGSESTIGFSRTGDANPNQRVQLKRAQMTPHGLQVCLMLDGVELTLNSELIGDFNVDNLLACVGVLSLLQFTPAQIEQAMQSLKPIPGRMEYLPAQQGWSAAVVDFAHTEQALRGCLESLQGSVAGDMFCVVGCGGDRDPAKRPRMAAVAERLADHVILTDDNPRTEAPEQIMRDMVAGLDSPEQARIIHDRETAIRTALSQAGPNDLVVVAGKGHEQVQIVGVDRIPFSDVAVIQKVRQEARR